MNGPVGFEAHLARAAALHAVGRDKECIEAAQKAIELEPNIAEPYFLLSMAWNRIPGRNKDSFSAIDRALACAPNRSDLHAWRAYVLLQLKRKKASIDAATRSLALDPHETFALIVRAQASIRLWKTGEAEKDLRSALSIDPHDLGALGLLALLLRTQHRLEESRRLNEMLLSSAPTEALGLTNAAWLLIEAGNLEAATELVLSALAHEPSNSYARLTLISIKRRVIFLYRWEEKWRTVALEFISSDWFRKRWWWFIIIPHAGALIFGCSIFLMIGCVIAWGLARSLTDFFILVNRKTRPILSQREQIYGAGEGLIIFPMLLYVILVFAFLRNVFLLFVLIGVVVASIHGAIRLANHIFPKKV